MENEPADYLQVPITERERVDARRRSRSVERLLPDAESVYSQPFEDDRSDTLSSGPSRFPSTRGHPNPSPVASAPQQRRYHSYQGGQQYAPISPIDEEEIADRASDVPSRPRTIPQSERSFEPLVPLPDLWSPIWLRRSTLAAFIAFFVICIVAVIVLWVLSATRTGFDVHFDGPHHAWWVYIPTIAAVLLVGIWRQVDYHTKSLTPWDELQRGPIGASKSLLLNYVSPLQIVALFQAFVHNHFPIVATVSSFIFLKILTVFSTGLFILLPKTVSQGSFPLISTTRFDAANANDITTAPVSAFLGNVYQGIALQPGVTSNLAYIPFRYDESRNEEIAENGTFSADVDAFVPVISCRVIDATLDGDSTVEQSSSGDAFGDGIRLRIPPDSICDNYSAMTIPAANPRTEIVPQSETYGAVQALTCGSGNETVALLFNVLDLAFEQDLRDGATQLALQGDEVAVSSSRSVRNMTSVICEANYTISHLKISNNPAVTDTLSQGISIETPSNSQNRTLDGFSNADIMSVFERLATISGSMFAEVPGGDESAGFFTLLAMSYGSRDVSRLLNARDLISATEATFTGIMAQYAHLVLSEPDEQDIQGEANRRQTRYVVNDASAAFMIAALTITTIAATMLLFNGPRAVVPRDPGSIAAIASTLTNSIELNRLLRRVAGGVPSEKNQEAALDGYEFGTAIATTEHGQASFRIVTSEGMKDFNAAKPDSTLRWWHPITSSIPFAVFVCAVPFLLIGLLHLTQKRSDDGGILSVPDNQATDIYTHYIPSLVMVIVASLLNLIDFNILVFTPWSAMASGAASAQRSILAHYLGITSPWAMYSAVRARHLNIVLSSLSVMIASILAIVAAGLYNVDFFTTEGTSISLAASSRFTLSWANSSLGDNGAAAMINSLLTTSDLNLTSYPYPAFTYRNLVLPSFTLPNSTLDLTNGSTRSVPTTSTNTTSTPITMQALQPDLRCYLIDRPFITLSTIPSSSPSQLQIEILANLPSTCSLGGPLGAANSIIFTNTFSLPSNSSGPPIYAARQNDLLLNPTSAPFTGNTLSTSQLLNPTNGSTLSRLVGDNPPSSGCPSLAFTFARVDPDTDFEAGDGVEGVTAMLCYQRIREVQAEVRLRGNTSRIDGEVKVDGSQGEDGLVKNPEVLGDGGEDEETGVKVDEVFGWRIQAALGRALGEGVFPGKGEGGEEEVSDMDAFFRGVMKLRAVTNGGGNADPEALVGDDGQTELLSAILEFYRLYMAQAISLNMREPLDAENGNTTLLSALGRRQESTNNNNNILGEIPTQITSPRLVQSNTSKILLQVLLGLVSVLMAAAYAMTRFRRVLPLDPNSIAGTMSLLAGGDLVHCEDDGRCECCGKPRRNSFGTVAEGMVGNGSGHLSMGSQQRQSGGGGGGAVSFVSAGGGEREGVIPVGAEWLDARSRVRDGRGDGRDGKGEWARVFVGRVYSLGWWREKKAQGRRRRWGVDVGPYADGEAEQDWELGEKRLRASRDVSPAMRFGYGGAGSAGENSGGDGYEMRDMAQQGQGFRGRGLEVPRMGEAAVDSYGEGGLRGESFERDTSMDRGRGGIAAAASEAGSSREGSVDLGEERRLGGGQGLTFSRGGYQRVEGDGSYRGEA